MRMEKGLEENGKEITPFWGGAELRSRRHHSNGVRALEST